MTKRFTEDVPEQFLEWQLPGGEWQPWNERGIPLGVAVKMRATIVDPRDDDHVGNGYAWVGLFAVLVVLVSGGIGWGFVELVHWIKSVSC